MSGHAYGTNSAEVAAAVCQVDEALGSLLDQIHANDLNNVVNVLVVSDHGMTMTDDERVIYLDDYVNSSDYTSATYASEGAFAPVFQLFTEPSKKERVYSHLQDAHAHLKVDYREDLETRLHYSSHRRIGDIVGIADEGWVVAQNKQVNSVCCGLHGYDNLLESMRPIFLAAGPSFIHDDEVIPPVRNVDLYELICNILDLTPSTNNGTMLVLQDYLLRS